MVPVALLLLARGAAAAPELPSFVRIFRSFSAAPPRFPLQLLRSVRSVPLRFIAPNDLVLAQLFILADDIGWADFGYNGGE